MPDWRFSACSVCARVMMSLAGFQPAYSPVDSFLTYSFSLRRNHFIATLQFPDDMSVWLWKRKSDWRWISSLEGGLLSLPEGNWYRCRLQYWWRHLIAVLFLAVGDNCGVDLKYWRKMWISTCLLNSVGKYRCRFEIVTGAVNNGAASWFFRLQLMMWITVLFLDSDVSWNLSAMPVFRFFAVSSTSGWFLATKNPHQDSR